MELASEDELRLRVLLANARAVRIDASHCIVYGCADGREFQVQLNPVGVPEKYLQHVREFLSTTVLGSPRHFPAHLRRWAGQGQFDNAPLDKLLLLGDSDALFATANSPRVTHELAQYIWWVAQDAEIARALLGHPAVVTADIGKIVAQWLLEYLPFETDTGISLRSLLALLQPGLLSLQVRKQLWERGRRKTVIRVAFIRACPGELAELDDGSVAAPIRSSGINDLVLPSKRDELWRDRIQSRQTQALLVATTSTLPNVSSQDEIIAVIEAIGAYFSTIPEPGGEGQDDGDALVAHRHLASLHSDLFTPLFARSDATGSVLRKKAEPLIAPVMTSLGVLARSRV